MFRSMVVALKPAPSQATLIEYSMAIAERLQLRIEGLSVVDLEQLAAAEPVPLGGDAYKVHRDQQRIELARQQANQFVSAFELAARAKSLNCHAQVSDGDTVRAIVRAVQTADLLMCGHTPQADSREESLLTSILKHVPRPVLLVPATKSHGQDVLVAYDSSFQSAQALSSFVHSGLANDRRITVFSFHEHLDVANERAKTAVEFLKRHNIVAEVLTEKLEREPGRHILDAAQRLSAGMLVMGAFGTNTVREFFFGSATRDVLRRLPVPVFLDH